MLGFGVEIMPEMAGSRERYTTKALLWKWKGGCPRGHGRGKQTWEHAWGSSLRGEGIWLVYEVEPGEEAGGTMAEGRRGDGPGLRPRSQPSG